MASTEITAADDPADPDPTMTIDNTIHGLEQWRAELIEQLSAINIDVTDCLCDVTDSINPPHVDEQIANMHHISDTIDSITSVMLHMVMLKLNFSNIY